MSIEAITWALKVPLRPTGLKFVLFVFANYADEEGLTWSATATLSKATSQNRKTILRRVERLRELGFLLPTEHRRGRTGRIPVYRLNSPPGGSIGTPSNGPNLDRNGPNWDPQWSQSGPPSLERKELNRTTKEDGMSTDYTPEMLERMRRGESPFSKASQANAGRQPKPGKAPKSYADFKKARAAAPPPARSTAELLPPHLERWFKRELLPLYPCPNAISVAKIVAELNPGDEECAAILADVRLRLPQFGDFKPWLGNYLRDRYWTYPLAEQRAKEIRDDDIPAGAGSIVGR